VSFLDLARPLAARGLPVVPVESGTKRCKLPNWPNLASTAGPVLEEWDRLYPSANVGCVAKPDGAAILDCDTPGLLERIEKETGQTIPTTLLVRSAGRSCPHVYFLQTERSRAIGNRKAASLFDFKVSNSYVVGPGSAIVTADGPRTYDILVDAPLAPFPDWLGDWIEAHSQAQKPMPGARATIPTSEGFDIHAFLEHYGLGYEMVGNWYVTDVCPVAGHKHEQSARTGFYYDGEHFGFNCFAANCPGASMTAGDVIKHLNKGTPLTAVAPYAGEIWKPREGLALLDPDVAAADWFIPAPAFLARRVPERRSLVTDADGATLLWSESVNQIFSYRGLGKTMLTHGLIRLLISGGEFLRFGSRGGNRVCLVDGELPDSVLQERLRMSGLGENLWLMNPGTMPNEALPHLADYIYQAELLKRLETLRPDVVVFDTLTACFRFDTNDSEGWDRVNSFYITLRRKGYCVLVVHHAGKNGSQRGRTDGDDNLDLAIKLSPPRGWQPGDGLQFKLEYEKVRAGGSLPEFVARYDGKSWECGADLDEETAEIVGLLAAGKSIRSIATALDVSPSKVLRVKKRAEKNGTKFDV